MAKKSIWFRIKRRINQKIIAPYIRQISGVEELERNIYFLLNSCVDITKCKPAEGILRQVQLADFELLKLFDKFCKVNNLTYWLDFGNLLGAVRHKGFIPWDDDMDVSMPREDFIKAIQLLPKYFCDTGYWFSSEEEAVNSRGFIGRKGGIALDFFPVDCVICKDEDDYLNRAKAYKIELNKHGKLKDENERSTLQKEIFNIEEGNKFLYTGLEFPGEVSFCFQTEVIFPLQKIIFEGEEFPAPKKSQWYLTKCYGNYMEFPHCGILHHKGLNSDAEKYNKKFPELINEMLMDNQKIELRLKSSINN